MYEHIIGIYRSGERGEVGWGRRKKGGEKRGGM